MSKTIWSVFKYFNEMEVSAALKREAVNFLRAPCAEIDVAYDHVDTTDRAQSITTKDGAGGAGCGGGGILIFRSVEIECLNYRFPTPILVAADDLLHIFKLERHGGYCEGLGCNQGRFKAVRRNRPEILDESEM